MSPEDRINLDTQDNQRNNEPAADPIEGGYVTRTEIAPSAEKKRFTRKQKIYAGLSVVALTLGIGGGIAASVANQNQPVAEAPADPTEAPTDPAPTPTDSEVQPSNPEQPANVFERTPLPAELAKYQTMSIEEFQTLPKEEQWLYASWLDQYRADFEKRFSLVSGNKRDTPVVVTPNSSGMDLFTDLMYSHRLASSFTPTGEYEPSDSAKIFGTLDKDSAIKLITSVYADYNDPLLPQDIAIIGHEGKAVNVDTLSASDSFSLKNIDILNEVKNGPATIVTFIGVDGVTYDITLIAQEIVTYDGKHEYRTVAGQRVTK